MAAISPPHIQPKSTVIRCISSNLNSGNSDCSYSKVTFELSKCSNSLEIRSEPVALH